MTADLDDALRIFSQACDYVHRAGLGAQVEAHRCAKLENFTETELLREAAWVILCSGFREAIVRRWFDHISLCFCDWESACAIVDASPVCKWAARSAFGHEAKLDAILGVAMRIEAVGFPALRAAVLADPIAELCRLPYIGPITVWHLAKNLGLNRAKPDRHLVRVSKRCGFADADAFCSAVAQAAEEETRVVDLIVWRFLADNPSLRQEWC